jgi:hypothetical protein
LKDVLKATKKQSSNCKLEIQLIFTPTFNRDTKRWALRN